MDPIPEFEGAYRGPLIYYTNGDRYAFEDICVELSLTDRDQSADIGLTAGLIIHDFPLDIEGKETKTAYMGLLWDGNKFKELPREHDGYFSFYYFSKWRVTKAHGLLQDWKDQGYKRLVLDTVILEDCPFHFDFSGKLDPEGYIHTIIQE